MLRCARLPDMRVCYKRNGFASFATKRRKKISFTDRCKQFYAPSSNTYILDEEAAEDIQWYQVNSKHHSLFMGVGSIYWFLSFRMVS